MIAMSVPVFRLDPCGDTLHKALKTLTGTLANTLNETFHETLNKTFEKTPNDKMKV